MPCYLFQCYSLTTHQSPSCSSPRNLDSPFPGLPLTKQPQTRLTKQTADIFAVKMKRTKILFQVLITPCICCEYLVTFVIAAAANITVTGFCLSFLSFFTFCRRRQRCQRRRQRQRVGVQSRQERTISFSYHHDFFVLFESNNPPVAGSSEQARGV